MSDKTPMTKTVPTLEEYMLSRGIEIEHTDLEKAITEDTQTLGAIAGTWENGSSEIELVVRKRIQKLREYIVMKATPYELISYRERMVELIGFLEDFEKYTEEFRKREPIDKNTGGTGSH